MNGQAEILEGDCMAVLPTLPADHFHCCVTSPPYFALRSYLPKDHPLKPKEIGSEPTPEVFIETMVAVFREVRRVLHPSGTLWLNLGDSYNANTGAGFNAHYKTRPHLSGEGVGQKRLDKASRNTVAKGTPQGQLLNIPHRVAEALRADGWIWRQTIVWKKPSPMPESCKGWRWERCKVKVEAGKYGKYAPSHCIETQPPADFKDASRLATWKPCPGCPKCSPHGGYVLRRGKGRCTTGHEYVFVFAKGRYFWDSAAFVEKAGQSPQAQERYRYAPSPNSKVADCPDNNWRGGETAHYFPATRNPRTVWTISAEPTSLKHFAAFPSELVRRCVQAGTSDGGCCPECGMPWAPVVERGEMAADGHAKRLRPAWVAEDHRDVSDQGWSSESGFMPNAYYPTTILGYRPTCECHSPGDETDFRCGTNGWLLHNQEAIPLPCRVLDPFAGTGRTLQTAISMGRDSTGIELNPEYVEFCRKTIQEPPRWWLKDHEPPPDVPEGQMKLFVETGQ